MWNMWVEPCVWRGLIYMWAELGGGLIYMWAWPLRWPLDELWSALSRSRLWRTENTTCWHRWGISVMFRRSSWARRRGLTEPWPVGRVHKFNKCHVTKPRWFWNKKKVLLIIPDTWTSDEPRLILWRGQWEFVFGFVWVCHWLEGQRVKKRIKCQSNIRFCLARARSDRRLTSCDNFFCPPHLLFSLHTHTDTGDSV